MTAHQPHERIAAVFSSALGVASIDWDTGFFDLGISSRMIVQVLGELRKDWPQLRVVDVFTYPTVMTLAAHLMSAFPREGEGCGGRENTSSLQ
ncbi:acyl carrier protein [Streptomyces sp. NPDC002920]